MDVKEKQLKHLKQKIQDIILDLQVKQDDYLLNELWNCLTPFALKIQKKYYSIPDDDFISLALDCMIKAVSAYDAHRGTFTTFYWIILSRKCITYINAPRHLKMRQTTSLDAEISLSTASEHDITLHNLLSEQDQEDQEEIAYVDVHDLSIQDTIDIITDVVDLSTMEEDYLRSYLELSRSYGKMTMGTFSKLTGYDHKSIDNWTSRVKTKLRQKDINMNFRFFGKNKLKKV